MQWFLNILVLILGVESSYTNEIEGKIITGDKEEKIVTIETENGILLEVDVKYDVSHFQPVGKKVNVDFACVKTREGICDFVSPYELKINGESYSLLTWRFKTPMKEFWVAHGPAGTSLGQYPQGIMIENVIGGYGVFMQLRCIEGLERIAHIGRGDTITVIFREDEPYAAYVDGAKLCIVALLFIKR